MKNEEIVKNLLDEFLKINKNNEVYVSISFSKFSQGNFDVTVGTVGKLHNAYTLMETISEDFDVNEFIENVKKTVEKAETVTEKVVKSEKILKLEEELKKLKEELHETN